ncbi:hypothetical protein [Streptomyces atrovirens]|uniref:GNAT family N-acetyltransferase n=1 Tax=Streptomyces atrovirens TaxID=285556 RepID=A0ABW0DWP4_9ACTN
MSPYEDSPEREWRRLRGIRSGRGRVSAGSWRLSFVVVVDGEPVGVQDLIGVDFDGFGTVTAFSWLSPDVRGAGFGKEVRRTVSPGTAGGASGRRSDAGG